MQTESRAYLPQYAYLLLLCISDLFEFYDLLNNALSLSVEHRCLIQLCLVLLSHHPLAVPESHRPHFRLQMSFPGIPLSPSVALPWFVTCKSILIDWLIDWMHRVFFSTEDSFSQCTGTHSTVEALCIMRYTSRQLSLSSSSLIDWNSPVINEVHECTFWQYSVKAYVLTLLVRNW